MPKDRPLADIEPEVIVLYAESIAADEQFAVFLEEDPAIAAEIERRG